MMSIKKGLSLKNRIKLKLVIVLTIATLLLSVFALYLVVNVKPEDDIDYLEITSPKIHIIFLPRRENA